MLDDLKHLFSRTWSAFQAEASRREPEDVVAELLSAMRREMVEARASLPLYDEEVARVRRELDRERAALSDCLRRRDLAERIGDAETVRVAEEFAGRHRRRVEVLEEKARAAQGERDLRAEEVERMMRQYRQTEAERFALVARLRAGGRLEVGSSAPADPDDTPGAARRGADPEALEERLRELKRRMGHE